MSTSTIRLQLDREQKESWRRAAGGWGRRQAELRAQSEPVATWLVEAINPQPGETVLELAAGPGETGFMIAARLGATGKLVSSDQSEEMVAIGKARASELGLENVAFKVLDAQQLPLDSESVDAVLCRWGYMLMADRDAALRESRRVLRTGGRVALSVWDRPDRNPWLAAPVMQLVSRGAFARPQPDEPSPFSMANQEELVRQLERAGFSDIHVEALQYSNRYEGFDHYWDLTLDLAAPVADAVAKLDDDAAADVREQVRTALQQFVDGDGTTLSIPASALMARAVG
jgi:ubiquinone/menaquinone biosynthesis C-methylase UbiE